MASKRGIKRKMCTGKKAYSDPVDAWKMARWQQAREGGEFAVRAYKCEFCKFWHVGHAPHRQKGRRRADYVETKGL